MIDHVIGALYFLNHLEHKHESVCSGNILIDDEGKFVLIDSIIFELDTNYQIALMELLNKNLSKAHSGKRNHCSSGSAYLSPELLAHLKNKHLEHHESSEKAEVFSVGLIALDMCLLDYKLLDPAGCQGKELGLHAPLLDRFNLKLNKNEMNKALIEARQRYSVELVDLLASML
jgi:hypothetical protein